MLKIRSLSCRVREHLVFEDLDLDVSPGEIVCVEGGSGRGKSSLLFAIRGITAARKHITGTLQCRGRSLEIGGPGPVEIRRRMGLVLQNPHSQMVSTLVKEELLLAHDTPLAPVVQHRYKTIVSLLGITPLLDRPVKHLSAGQKHMVAIGAVLLMDLELLMMDEPFLYLDAGNIGRVLDCLHHLRRTGTAMLITSHPGIVPTDRVNKVVPLKGPERCFQPGIFASSANPTGMNAQQPSSGPVDPCIHDHPGIIRLEDVTIGHTPGAPILKGLHMMFQGGKETWITGENGSGKTTLLNLLAGDGVTDHGEILRQGRNGACRVMIITQNPDRHFFESTVHREMEAAVMGKDRDPEILKTRGREITTLIRSVGLEARVHVSPFKLSFGEKVFLSAAQAVLLRPDFICVDDILGFMDRKERTFLLTFLRGAMQCHGMGLILTTSRGCFAEEGGTTVYGLRPSDDPVASRSYASGVSGSQAPQSDGPSHLNTPAMPAMSNAQRGGRSGTRRPSWKRRLWKAMKLPALDFVPGDSPVHRSPPLLKMGVSMVVWFMTFQLGPEYYPHMTGLLVCYYLLTGLGVSRLLADTRFFVIQAMVFALVLPLFRRDLSAALEGGLSGIRVWLFFLPVMVMMRTTTVSRWMGLFAGILSRERQLAVGIAFGLLPCITADAREIFQVQRRKGLAPEKRDLMHPRRLLTGLRAIFIPLLIVIEDVSSLAGLSVKLRGLTDE
jgi:energy-coupling factor transporter ATP-binding protein EcfA2/energy-coupling factor transporter transmembrane protein EcfT